MELCEPLGRYIIAASVGGFIACPINGLLTSFAWLAYLHVADRAGFQPILEPNSGLPFLALYIAFWSPATSLFLMPALWLFGGFLFLVARTLCRAVSAWQYTSELLGLIVAIGGIGFSIAIWLQRSLLREPYPTEVPLELYAVIGIFTLSLVLGSSFVLMRQRVFR